MPRFLLLPAADAEDVPLLLPPEDGVASLGLLAAEVAPPFVLPTAGDVPEEKVSRRPSQRPLSRVAFVQTVPATSTADNRNRDHYRGAASSGFECKAGLLSARLAARTLVLLLLAPPSS